jgi:hypothetical protein
MRRLAGQDGWAVIPLVLLHHSRKVDKLDLGLANGQA